MQEVPQSVGVLSVGLTTHLAGELFSNSEARSPRSDVELLERRQ